MSVEDAQLALSGVLWFWDTTFLIRSSETLLLIFRMRGKLILSVVLGNFFLNCVELVSFSVAR